MYEICASFASGELFEQFYVMPNLLYIMIMLEQVNLLAHMVCYTIYTMLQIVCVRYSQRLHEYVILAIWMQLRRRNDKMVACRPDANYVHLLNDGETIQ